MRAELKHLHSPDVDLESFVPPDPGSFGFLLQMMIGPEGEESSESFDVQVCTPQWLLEKRSRGVIRPVVMGEPLIVVFSYDLHQLRSAISAYCDRCVGDDWASIVNKIAKIGAWEFEGYQDGKY